MFTLLYLTQPAPIPTLLSTVMARGKKRSLNPFQNLNDKSWRDFTREDLQQMVLCAIWQKNAKLSPSKVREFLRSKTSYTRFTQAIRKFKKMRAFARFKDESWCMDLAYVDKLAKDKNGVRFLLVRQNLFDRTVDAKGMKTKYSKETVKTFSKMITKKDRPKKLG